MTSDIDIFRTAKLLIQKHGTAAWLEAANTYRDLRKEGDEEGSAVWHRVAEAIASLDDIEGDGAVH